ncbi:hypothetical protein [Hafnia paralvei]|uniref:hypothetical protein n=1 Tax=Hafnia paralvei TaxID=546367 RepID=UPI00300D5FA0
MPNMPLPAAPTQDDKSASTELPNHSNLSTNSPVIPDAYVLDELGRMMLNGVCEPRIGFGSGWNAYRAKMLKAQPVSEPKSVGYFSYGSEHGFDWHKTEKEAIESAEAAIDEYRGDACDGWSEETDSICWGVILQNATKVDERPRTDDDKCDPAIDTVCDYALLPARED